MDEEFLRDLFASLPAVSIRRMFGGQGIYSQGRIVAVVIRGTLHLKGNSAGESAYEAAGLERWTYQRPGRSPVAMPYWRMPDEAVDDPDEAARWIAVADEAARRVALTEKHKRKGAPRRRRPQGAGPAGETVG